MARGFDSKSVEDQQLDAQDAKDRQKIPPGTGPSARRRSLELACADVSHRLETASNEAHRVQLRATLAAIEKDLAALEG